MAAHLVWFRRDLRTIDHEALSAAAGTRRPVAALFVLDPQLLHGPRRSQARLAYLSDALRALDRALRDRGTRLVVRRGDPRDVVPRLAAELHAEAVHWSADHTPYAAARDAAVRSALEAAGIRCRAHPGVVIHEPGTVRTSAGTPFKVFTPFRRAWLARPVEPPLDGPARIVGAPAAGEAPPSPAELGATTARAAIEGGEAAARARLDAFLEGSAGRYHTDRDRLDRDGTSRLSADLHYGCISPRAVWARLDRRKPGHQAFATELLWREFCLHVLAAWPTAAGRELDAASQALPWRGESAVVEAWRAGRTGYPVVDAGMRQLLAEAWMHNRARMIVASFLCKHLLVDWRIGEAHFLSQLVDGDVANNNCGWQWAAGTGTDAQPYFRMFNPVRQGERYDPDGSYVRRYVPELAAVPARWIHRPWAMPPDVAAEAGVRLGRDYPVPIVDHDDARAEALAWFKRHRRRRQRTAS